ncbi:hypothetical protein GTY85_25285 [Streptomyces sp. SID8377]|nr:hypothetical protein [Streptomyces sp. SID8377]
MWSGLAVGFWLFFWWVILRTRLEVGPGGIVAVNPWGTHRLALNEVVSVRLGAWGAEFYREDGFKITAYALSELAAGTPQDRHFAEVQAALKAGQSPSSR